MFRIQVIENLIKIYEIFITKVYGDIPERSYPKHVVDGFSFYNGRVRSNSFRNKYKISWDQYLRSY